MPKNQHKKILTTFHKNQQKWSKNIKKRVQPFQTYIADHKLLVAGLALLLFAGAITAAQFIQKPIEEVVQEEVKPLMVKAMVFGDSQLNEQTVGTIKNLTSITLVAQSAGPVQTIDVVEGDTVQRGTRLLQQETAYSAGNSAAVSTQVAQKNYELADETLKSTVETVAKTREQADLNRNNTEELRKISEQSVSDTEALLAVTEDVVEKIEDDIADEQAGSNDPDTILALRKQLVSYQGTLNTTRASLRSVQYDIDTDNPPTKLAEVSRDLIYVQTELQLKTAQLQKDIAHLNARIARIQEAATRVNAPFVGTIEKLYVQPGEYVTPGTPVAVIRGQTELCLQINVAGKLAAQIDESQDIVLEVNGEKVGVPITHVSATPVNGQLYEVLALLPDTYDAQVYENQTLNVTLPLYDVTIQTGNAFVPLDAVFITNTSRYVFVEEDGVAQKKEVETGDIVGTSIEIKNGLQPGAKVILDRRVIDQQPIEIELITEPGATQIELG